MATVLTNQLIAYSLDIRGANPDLEALAVDLQDSERDGIQAILSELLRAEAQTGRVKILDAKTGAPTVFHSIIYDSKANRERQTVIAFSFSDATSEALIPLCGLIITAFVAKLDLRDLDKAFTVAKAFWTNLAVLRSPKDDDAIAVVRAIAKIRARHKLKNDDEDPSNSEIFAEIGLGQKRTTDALRRLIEARIVKASQWGGKSDDYGHAANRWTVRL